MNLSQQATQSVNTASTTRMLPDFMAVETPARSKGHHSKRAVRLAIVGCGPRGMQCLESLTRHLTPRELRHLSVTIFEPTPHLGAGHIYDPDQPKTLRMNFATQYIDFWKTNETPTTRRDGSLLGWLRKRHSNLATHDAFIPRAIVGEYLCDCFERVREDFIQHADLKIQRQRVSDIRSSGDQWHLTAGSRKFEFDQVVITTGHEGLRSSSRLDTVSEQTAVFPVETQLSTNRIAPSSGVLMRGFGLTAIDAVIALTEGRGGRFDGEGLLPRYITGGDEPGVIQMVSRSGRPMLAKPTGEIEPIVDRFWMPFRERLNQCRDKHGELHFHRDVWSIILDAAAELVSQSLMPISRRDVENWYRQWSRYKADARFARHAMLQSLAVATGRRPMDIPFAVGEAWRKLYPELVKLISFGGLADGQHEKFTVISREMERIAFGPPAENVAKLLRLIRDRIVVLTDPGAEVAPHDITVNAVIAPPQDHVGDGPIQALIQRGTIGIDPSTGAVMVNESGHAMGRCTGLAIFGRATEGWVVGNDTLSRTLHSQMDCWAEAFKPVVVNASF